MFFSPARWRGSKVKNIFFGRKERWSVAEPFLSSKENVQVGRMAQNEENLYISVRGLWLSLDFDDFYIC